MQSIFALFPDYEQARAAVGLLVEHRFRPEAMNVIVSDYVVKDRFRGQLDRLNILATELKPGLDRLVAGEQPLNTPDAGNIHASGIEATTMVKTASLAESGSEGLASAMEEFGLSRQVAEESISSIRGGGVLFWVKTDDARAADAAIILRDHKGRYVGHYASERLPG